MWDIAHAPPAVRALEPILRGGFSVPQRSARPCGILEPALVTAAATLERMHPPVYGKSPYWAGCGGLGAHHKTLAPGRMHPPVCRRGVLSRVCKISTSAPSSRPPNSELVESPSSATFGLVRLPA